MMIEKTPIEGAFIYTPTIHKDHRGYFTESFNQKNFEEILGQKINFVQDNEAFSKKGVLRGLHFQKGEHAQSKLIKVSQGKIQDVIVDLRTSSSSFMRVFSVILDDLNKKQLFIPKGIAHGYLTLSETAIVQYKCDAFYEPTSESGIIYNDLNLSIDWGLSDKSILLSEKDLKLPSINQLIL